MKQYCVDVLCSSTRNKHVMAPLSSCSKRAQLREIMEDNKPEKCKIKIFFLSLPHSLCWFFFYSFCSVLFNSTSYSTRTRRQNEQRRNEKEKNTHKKILRVHVFLRRNWIKKKYKAIKSITELKANRTSLSSFRYTRVLCAPGEIEQIFNIFIYLKKNNFLLFIQFCYFIFLPLSRSTLIFLWFFFVIGKKEQKCV